VREEKAGVTRQTGRLGGRRKRAKSPKDLGTSFVQTNLSRAPVERDGEGRRLAEVRGGET
jgi:hypothetical protein